MTPGQPRTFRAAVWLIVVVVLGLAAFCAATWFMYRQEGISFTMLGLAVGSALALGGLADVLTTRVTLEADAIESFAKFRYRRIPRADIIRVVAEKGCPIALELRTGGWAKLPELGGRLHPNTLRAWLKRG